MKLHLGQGTTIGAITLVPVWNESGGRRRYTTAADALQIAELEYENVQALQAVNRGRRDVLVPDGQLFEGGLQHRMATRSAIISAGTSTALHVACVEAGRWSGEREQRSEGRRASEFIRAGWYAGGQAEVWSRIGTTAAAGSATGSYVEMRRDDVPHRADHPSAQQITRTVRPLPGQAGVLIGIGGLPLKLEVFDDSTTLREQFDAIVEAAFYDVGAAPTVPTPGRRSRRLIRRFEELVAHLETDGEDHYRSAYDARLDVARLDHRGRPAHLRITDRRHPVVAGQ